MRSLEDPIEKDLGRKMVFLAGPRQVGKTTLAKHLLSKGSGRYLTWDDAADRQVILRQSFLQERFIVLDELHKYDRWKNYLKGLYDKHHESLRMLVTGSARLDVYRRGGDSLLGRYFLFHLHPLTMGEVLWPGRIPKPEEILGEQGGSGEKNELLTALLRYGGFPEPFFAGTEEAHRRWSLLRNEILVREDIRDLTQVTLLSLVEHLLLLLPGRVGSPLSLNALKEDLQVAYNTVRSWIDTLERLYIVFTLQAYTEKIGRAVKKERKLYLWDWSQIPDEGARFENLVASHLWKAVHLWRDLGYGDFALYFLRDRDRREVDFLLTRDRKPWLLVEAKAADTQPAENLVTFANRLNLPAVQVVGKEGVHRCEGRVTVISADRWLPGLP